MRTLGKGLGTSSEKRSLQWREQKYRERVFTYVLEELVLALKDVLSALTTYRCLCCGHRSDPICLEFTHSFQTTISFLLFPAPIACNQSDIHKLQITSLSGIQISLVSLWFMRGNGTIFPLASKIASDDFSWLTSHPAIPCTSPLAISNFCCCCCCLSISWTSAHPLCSLPLPYFFLLIRRCRLRYCFFRTCSKPSSIGCLPHGTMHLWYHA